MKIGLILDRLTTGGTERQMELLLSELPSDVEATLLALRSDAGAAERFGKHAKVCVLDVGRSSYLTLPIAIKRWAREERVDAVLAAHRFSGLLAKLAKLFGMSVPVACALRGRARFNFKQRLIYDFIDPALMPLASAIIINSQAMRQTLPAWPWLHSKIVCIPNGLAHVEIDQQRARDELRGRFGWSDTRPIIATMGRIVDVKRPDVASACMRALHSMGRDAHYLWIGDGPLRVDLERSFRNAQASLACTGFVDSPEQLLAGADVYFHPSSWENTSNAILEAMRARLPVLARRLPGNVALIDEERTGLLFESEAEATEKLLRLCNDAALRQSLGQQGHDSVMEQFSPNKMATAHLDLLRSIAGLA